MTTSRTVVFVVCAALVGGCAGEVAPAPAPEKPDIAQFGVDRGNGNLLGVQPSLTALDYATPERLDAKLRAWLDAAKMQELLGPRTVVVFPEYMGTWLVAVDEGPDVVEASSISDALTALAAAHPVELVAALATAPADDGMAYAAFATKAKRMAEVHEQIFSSIARDYGVTVTGASTLLPRPRVHDGHIVIGEGEPLRNVVFTFRPDGTLDDHVVQKSFPTASELPFVEPAPVDELPVLDTPAGKLGVLICADSWYPEPYARLEELGAEVLAVPVFVDGDWDAPWGGYSGHDEPGDVDGEDIGALTEAEAWSRYSAPGRAAHAGIAQALTVTLRGSLWDLVDDGQPLVVNGPARERAPRRDGALLVSLWR
jgi:predicted amidohydrolase